jgi:hypothetical protein
MVLVAYWYMDSRINSMHMAQLDQLLFTSLATRRPCRAQHNCVAQPGQLPIHRAAYTHSRPWKRLRRIMLRKIRLRKSRAVRFSNPSVRLQRAPGEPHAPHACLACI